MASTGMKLAAASVLGLSCLLGCRTGPEHVDYVSPLPKLPVANYQKNSYGQEIMPVFQGGLKNAAAFMKNDSFGAGTEKSYLYIPERQLLFDVGFLEYPSSVNRDAAQSDQISQFYRSAGIKFHTHLDHYSRNVVAMMERKFDENMRQITERLQKCNAQSVLTPEYILECNPLEIKFTLDRLNEWKEYTNAPEMVLARHKGNRIWTSYCPSTNDIRNSMISELTAAGQKAGIVVVDDTPETTVVWYSPSDTKARNWFNGRVKYLLLEKKSFTKDDLDRLIAGSAKRGIEIRQEVFPPK